MTWRAGLALALALWCAGAACAGLPPLPLPAWVQVDLTMDRPPEIGRTAVVRLRVVSLLARLEGVRWEITLPREMAVEGGARSGVLTLEQGKPVEQTLEARANAPMEGASLFVEVKTRPPREELAAEVARRFPAEKDRGTRMVRELPREDIQRRFIGFTVGAEQSFFATAPGPAWRHVLRTASGAELIVLDAAPGLDAKAVERSLAEVEGRLERFRKIATGKPEDPLGPVVESLEADRIRLRYQRGMVALEAGKSAEAKAAFGAEAGALPPALQIGRRAAVALAGDLPGASSTLEAMCAESGPARKYLEYDRGELLRVAGKAAEAREAYRRAIEAGRVEGVAMTIAAAKLETLK